MRSSSRPPAPSTPASVPGAEAGDGAAFDDDDALQVPPAPGFGVVVGSVVAGAVVAVMTLITTVCVWQRLSWDLPDDGDVYGNGAFFTGAAVVLVIALASWWRALASRQRDPARWMGLALPFFVVVGVAGGVSFARAVFVDRDDDERTRWQCERLLGVYGEHVPVVRACVDVAARCRDAGFERHFTKPIDVPSLLQVLDGPRV